MRDKINSTTLVPLSLTMTLLLSSTILLSSTVSADDYFYYTGTPEGTDASNKLRAYPNNFVYSGGVIGGSVDLRGSYGYFWSSTASSSGSAYYLLLGSSVVYPGTSNNNKYSGRAVRCVALGV